MRVLMVSLDRKAFVEGDPARARLSGYGEVFEELHIIVYAKRSLGLRTQKIAPNVWLHPTNSFSKLFYVADAIGIARGLAGERAFSIVSGQDLSETGFAAWCIARQLDLPVQLQDHADVFDSYFARESLGNRMRVALARFLLPKADCIRTVLPAGKERIVARFPYLERRISVLPVFTRTNHLVDAVPAFSLRERYPQFKTIFLMASRLVSQKDIGFALKAFKEANVEGAGLIIVGEGPLAGMLKEEVHKLGLEEKVVFLPWQQDLVPYYQGADLFLLSSAYESYGRTLVEAAAAGLPFIATDVGIAPALVAAGAQGAVVTRGDVAAFRDALRAPMARGVSGGLRAVEALVGRNEAEYRERYRATLARCAGGSHRV